MLHLGFQAVLLGLLLVGPIATAGATPVQDGDARRQARRTPVVEVFENCREAVVNIAATQFVERRGFGAFDDMFEQMFDFPAGPRRTMRLTSMGSGFVLHESGYIVTNAHVVASTAERKVLFANGSEYEAEAVAVDTDLDLAILKIEVDKPLKTLTLGRSDDLMVGETVVAIGNPLGYQHTVTSGVISALDRTVDINEALKFEGLIQTDASINHGNSGGPLLNVLGELIGVNTAIRADAQNIGFAIPVDQLKARLPELLSIERRYRVETGLRLTAGDAVVVEEVLPDSAAAEAGLREGDIIRAVDGYAVADLVDFQIALLGHQPQENVEFRITRGNSTILTSLELRERPLPDGLAITARRLGATIEALDREQLAAMKVRGQFALRVTDVEPGGPAASTELSRGDYLLAINGQYPASTGDLGQLWESVPVGEVVTITFVRLGPRGRTQWTVPVATR